MPYLCTAIRKERAITLRFERASKFILTTAFCSKLPSQNSVAFTLKQNDAPQKSLSVRFLRQQRTLPSTRETMEETIHSLTDIITISSFTSYATDRVNFYPSQNDLLLVFASKSGVKSSPLDALFVLSTSRCAVAQPSPALTGKIISPYSAAEYHYTVSVIRKTLQTTPIDLTRLFELRKSCWEICDS